MIAIRDTYVSDESADEEVSKSKKIKAYSTEWKLDVVNHAKLVSIHSASKKYVISRACIRDWVKKEGKLKSLKDSCRAGKTRKRLRGSERPLQFKDLDKELATWVREQRGKKHRVSRRIIQQQAGKMFNAEEDEGLFMGSFSIN
uniref:HTH CENPB-type domain-containing protein n=1 Tax=Ditylenchus dipsaci TaxID=166011 RepID=A0A915EPU6_9BILA